MAKNLSGSMGPRFPDFASSAKMRHGYYSGDKPNPILRAFVQECSAPYDAETDGYEVAAFDEAITTTKATAVYNMHTYWSKKPHDAIRQYIRHYTRPGDIVLDPFCGSGGTALAALMESRRAVAFDRSPSATFITKNHCTPIDVQRLALAFEAINRKVQSDIEWLYGTKCDRCGGKAIAGNTVYSQVFQCPRCLKKTPLFDCCEVEGRTQAGKLKSVTACPSCHASGHVEEISTREKTFGFLPVMVSYICQNGCKPARAERRHNDSDPKRQQFFREHDLGKIREIESRPVPYWYPLHRMMNVEDDLAPWGDKWRAGTSSFRTVAELFTKRNLWALAAINEACKSFSDAPVRDFLLFTFESLLLTGSIMQQYREAGGGFAKGTYYVPQVFLEREQLSCFVRKQEQMLKGARELQAIPSTEVVISTQSACDCSSVPSDSVDYIFTDPPYADKVQYGELNFVWEAWLGFDTHWHDDEVIVNHVRGKTEADWAAMMRLAMAECYRVLKPGRWLSLCYHDTSEGTWELVQDILAEVGFVVDKTDSTLFIDTGQKSYNQLVSDKATKRDLVINFRKPKPGDWRITRVVIPPDVDVPTFQELGRQVVRDFLTAHPGAPKDRIYDELVSHMVRKGQMEAHDFDALLRGAAEEVRQPVKEDLFDNKEPDLFGSHVASRWYLKDTADQIDRAEQEKEDAAAERLGKFMGGYLTKHAEQEGVHYSDLFEQYLPVADKPRRLLADWLPEYFFKTTEGTWRPPADDEERQQKAALRGAGTLRRMKRFANALIDGVPVRDQDRPGNDRTLAEWIRQCRRAGLYEQGRALYEKGGLNLESLADEEQIAVEDDYRTCVKRKGEGADKPKRGRKPGKKGTGPTK